MAGNDASAVGSYSIDGAQNGLDTSGSCCWQRRCIIALSLAVRKSGGFHNRGLANLLRKHYGRPVALAVSLLLIVSNIALIAADLAAISTGLELITNGAITLVLVYHSCRRYSLVLHGVS